MRSQDQEAMATSLARKYPLFAETTIARWVEAEARRYDSASIQTFVPILVERAVEAALKELGGPGSATRAPLALADHALDDPSRPGASFHPPGPASSAVLDRRSG